MKTSLLTAAALSLALVGCGPATKVDTAKTATSVADKHAGMAMGGHDDETHAPTMKLALSPNGPLAPGRAQGVTLTLTNIASGKPLGPSDLALAHTKRLHLLIVDGSLTDYQHIHPLVDPAKSGQWRFDFTPLLGRTYKVWADATLPDGTQEYIGAELVAGAEKAPLPSTATVMTAEKDGLKFSLSFSKPLKVGQAAQGSIAIVDTKTGKPFAALQPIMGAFGHIVAFAGNWDSIEHVHPLGEEPKSEGERSGPAINFHIQPEQSGVLKLFAQVRANGRETIVPFTANVAP